MLCSNSSVERPGTYITRCLILTYILRGCAKRHVRPSGERFFTMKHFPGLRDERLNVLLNRHGGTSKVAHVTQLFHSCDALLTCRALYSVVGRNLSSFHFSLCPRPRAHMFFLVGLSFPPASLTSLIGTAPGLPPTSRSYL